MLAIRMQRLGRKGHPTYRVVVQDSRQTPTSGKVVAMLGSYDPHTKKNSLVKDKAQLFLDNGAQPSDRVVKLFITEGINLPKWVRQPVMHTRDIRHTDKLRRNRPPEEKTEAPAAEATEAAVAGAEDTATSEPVTTESEAPAETESSTETEAPETKDDADEPDEAPAPGSDEFPEDTSSAEKPVEEVTEPESKEVSKDDSENTKEKA